MSLKIIEDIDCITDQKDPAKEMEDYHVEE